MVSSLLAFRPASALDRLDPRSQACPLSTRELIGPAAALGVVLPLVRAPTAAVARAALVAAKELRAAIGLGLPDGLAPEPWFAAVTRVADEVAAGLPFFLAAEIVVEGEGATQVERAFHEAWRLAGAGVTHLALDVAAVAPGERARVVAEVMEAGTEHGLAVEVVLPVGDGARLGERAAATFEELARRGTPADVASLRFPAPASRDEARLQAAALARLAQAMGGAPVMRRGPVTPALAGLLRGSPVKICEDGGAIAAHGAAAPGAEPSAEGRTRAAALGPPEAAPDAEGERLEARAYFDALELLEALGAAGGAPALAAALERRLEER